MRIGGAPLWAWGAFHAFVFGALALDLGVLRRGGHVVGMREAARWSVIWVACALLFALWIASREGAGASVTFLTAYAVEESLSLDNLFVIALIFHYFAVPAAFQHRVLMWGILGALVMRGTMIAAGVVLLARISWTTYVFGAILIVAGARTLMRRGEEFDPERSLVHRLLRRLLPVAPECDDPRFFVRTATGRAVTPLFLVLILIESSDAVFAVDSIPAVLAVTTDPFLAYTSNIFALLGLRSLYFVLSGMLPRFRYLPVGLSAVLLFVGAKMLLGDVVHLPAWVSLVVVLTAVGAAVVASLRRPAAAERDGTSPA